MRVYCTLFDKSYLPNFLALHQSLKSKKSKFIIYAFCMDDLSYDFLKENYSDQSISPRSHAQLLNYFPDLEEVKKHRSIVEFYFTCSPFICKYTLVNQPDCDYVTYLDADLYFFGDPEIIFEEIKGYSISIIQHKFYGWGKRYLKYGEFNVGWVTFKNDKTGTACLELWLEECKSWCYDFYDELNQRFGDQKYLDKWPIIFDNVKVIELKGANLAPWNVGQYKLSISDTADIFVDNDPLIFYHFASFKKLGPSLYTTSSSRYFSRPNKILKNKIYKLYLREITNFSSAVNAQFKMKCIEGLSKNRNSVHSSTLNKKLTENFTEIRRWFFNDYINLNDENPIR